MAAGTLTDTVAVVTGASSGIGWETARSLAAEGATVVVFARRADRLGDLVGAITEAGGKAQPVQVDVTDAEAVAHALAEVKEQFGRVDILVNNAGFLANAPALQADLADWHRMIDVNVGGVLNTVHAALPLVVAAASGPRGVADIVTVSSVAGRRVPSPESNVYSASKHAVVALSEALRQELADRKVRVGLIEPGIVRTEMTTGGSKGAPDGADGAPLLPEDIAAAIVFMVTRPSHAAVNEILVRPTEQTR